MRINEEVGSVIKELEKKVIEGFCGLYTNLKYEEAVIKLTDLGYIVTDIYGSKYDYFIEIPKEFNRLMKEISKL